MGYFERLGDMAALLGYTYKREHLDYSPAEVSEPYWHFLRSMAANATVITTSIHNLSDLSDRLKRFQDGIPDEDTIELLRWQDLQFIQLDKDDVDALSYGIRQYLEQLRSAQTTLFGMFLTSAVSSFEAYLQDAVYEIHTRYTETLRSSRTLTYQEALECPSMDELVACLARKEAAKTTEGTPREYLERLQRKFGVDLDWMDILIQAMDRCVAIRNVIVHNDGIVDRTYLRRQPTELLREGERLELQLGDVAGVSEIIRLTANFVELELARKFPLIADVRWSEEAGLCLDHILAMEEFAAPNGDESDHLEMKQ